ncbi:type II toxin-antitoxin system RelE/ParE family toxin [Mannheimia haemolytica]|uniref:type II toxin-antitoxin system RelE/ParE family toxin n=1 Tax=Mannheimia haemolytica TaxID=75985 RepID=UPI000386065A|nr:type II toxin-antitoxin system mRNA interferase toxin, RelE/StbE family [Mannheimia haemolytica]EPZ00456.1 translation repressor RelE [Mannheimia haemolytica D35]MDW1150665.1 type II toxin-antitoxin system mRNA interferase toxin, RelE/StbE family [Mannheimia haemolytica]MDW1160823.1 type II toxin-antitoxin system mRNA interferase toxin, RelE/StbE family [Mannheimia haemolytica]NBB67765.1 type II toxin-antitoxin system mRNA interferase toxin, RelE/StbE family [Mannheimia haemolytica]TRC50059
MREIEYSNAFKRDYKKCAVESLSSSLIEALYFLINDKPLPEKYCDHALTGEWKGFRDCHIQPDLALIYRKVEDDKLELLRIGSHSHLFG